MWYTVIERSNFVFKVQSCSDANILLTEFFAITDYDVYEIIIGTAGNRRSLIRYSIFGNHLVEEDTDSLLHCSQSRWFWIEWSSRGIYVGSGYVIGDNVFLSLAASKMPRIFPVYSLAVMSGLLSNGSWEFSAVPGMQFLCYCVLCIKRTCSCAIFLVAF